MNDLPIDPDAAEEAGPVEAFETSLLHRVDSPNAAPWLLDQVGPAPWGAHPNFGQLASFWQQVHRELRGQGAALRTLLEDFRNAGHDPAAFSRAFSSRLRYYLQHLETHHRVEDGLYFPRFRQLDARLVRGFDLLEADHEIIHSQLLAVAESGQRLLTLVGSAAPDVRASLDEHSAHAERLVTLLDRHLEDEEDLVIPAILLFGEAAIH